ncbi:MAG: hypothetical protein KDD53_08370, partial [Bdellovibrionales bacterium]|nr:hypothetical protein [Bdellovibrionales bacterium]
PSLETKLMVGLGEDTSTLGGSSRISYVYVDASTSNENLDDFYEESWIWKNYVYYDRPLGEIKTFGNVLIRPSIGRVDTHGSARDGFEFNNFYEFGLDLVARDLSPNYFSEIGLGATYLYEDEVQGWRFGILCKLA